MGEDKLIPHLFRTEYRNIVSVLCYLFGIKHIEIAEDLVSDTFLSATELWSIKGTPENPKAWLYAVAKNKTKNLLKRNVLFDQKIMIDLQYSQSSVTEIELDLSPKNVADSQLAMMFTVCNPCNPAQAQIALALNLLCGFGIQEIADAFLTNKEVIYKRLNRAKEKLKERNTRIEPPGTAAIAERLPAVLTTLYLLFSEGYYSTSQNTVLRKELCQEAMRLNNLLMNNATTNTPASNALFALMCYHSSRFDARTDQNGQTVLYEDQDESLWDLELIDLGTLYLNKASTGPELSKYHLEAGIAYWHTHKEDSVEKWKNILSLYNQLLVLEYSPIAALNRTYALAKAKNKEEAIGEARKLKLTDNPFYFTLLGHLYTGIDDIEALNNFEQALALTTSDAGLTTIYRHIDALSGK